MWHSCLTACLSSSQCQKESSRTSYDYAILLAKWLVSPLLRRGRITSTKVQPKQIQLVCLYCRRFAAMVIRVLLVLFQYQQWRWRAIICRMGLSLPRPRTCLQRLSIATDHLAQTNRMVSITRSNQSFLHDSNSIHNIALSFLLSYVSKKSHRRGVSRQSMMGASELLLLLVLAANAYYKKFVLIYYHIDFMVWNIFFPFLSLV